MPLCVHVRHRCLLSLLVIALLAAPAGGQILGSMSEEEEIAVGRQAAAEIEKDLELLTDDLVTSYVSDLGQRLVDQSRRASIPYTFKVVNQGEINAFALPGGFIYINRGLIEAADNEAELAGVMGHEIGHVVARHGAEQAQRASITSLGLGVLGSILGRGTGAQVANMGAELAASGVFMKFGRDAEREADRLGTTNVAAVGLDPVGMITFFQKLAAVREGQPNAVERFFASHPQPDERVENIEDLVRDLRRNNEFDTTSRRFGEVKARLAELAPVETADAPDENADATPATAVPTDLPSVEAATPVTAVRYDGADLDREIAARFAPVFRQALGSEPRYDYVTRFDFDGDWVGDNNWENAADPTFPLTASIYYNVSETETHYFIHYAAFHPRDYKGGSVRGSVLSEIIREGAERHGDYDPTGLSAAAVLAHENDMEGALVVVEKPSGLFGGARVVYVETLAHNQFLRYAVDRSWLGGGGAETVPVEDEHAVLFIEPKGHGIEGYHGGDQVASADGFVTYRYTGQAQAPSGGRDEEVGYDLISLTETLWPAARARHRGVYDGTFDYRVWSVTAADGSGGVRTHEMPLGHVSSLLRGVVGGANMARPPWGWYDQDEVGDEGHRQGAWFLTPAETVKLHFGLDERFSTTYLHHPALGLYRRR